MADRGDKEKQNKKPSRALIVRTLFLLAVCGVAAFVLLAMKLYEVQVASNGSYEASALSAQLRHSTIPAARGSIFDVNGKILAMSASVENVCISPFDLERDEQDVFLIAEGLSAILGIEREMIVEKAAKSHLHYQVIKPRVESGEAGQVRAFIKEHKIKGVFLEPATKRYYPNNSLASQILGFIGTDNTGLYGMEKQYDSLLNGVSGRQVRLMSARGADLRLSDFEDFYDAQDGHDITLTIDSSVQYYVEKHLAQAIEDYDVLGGAMCIAMNAKTGAILATANYPNYDPNDFQKLSERELDRLSKLEDEQEYREAVSMVQFRQWSNRALADTYEPGSVFKILTLAMAIEENIATPDSTFYCTGAMHILGRLDREQKPLPLRCWRRWGHGEQTLKQAMENSCNTACVELGLGLGARTFYKYRDAFGLDDRTGLDNAVEGRSIWWSDSIFFDRNNQSQLASAAIGQTFTVTPIQMITAVAATVNGGYLMQPYLVQQITDCAGNIVEVHEPTVIRQVISAETSAAMRSILEDVVKNGTGKNAQVRGYRVGGKTGTSEDVVGIALNEEGAAKDYIASFVGFAPADDPEIVVLLLLEKPSHKTGVYISGGAMAAPVVGNMLADILPLSLGIRPQYTEADLGDINVHVPRVSGRDLEDAVEMLSALGFEYKIIGEGDSVTGQLPASNAHVASGTTVVLYAGEEIPREDVTVPNLSEMSYGAARKALENRGLYIRTTGAPKSDSKAQVSVQSIPAGREVSHGSVVEVTLIDREIIELRN